MLTVQKSFQLVCLDKVKGWEEIQAEASSNIVLHFLLGVIICFP